MDENFFTNESYEKYKFLSKKNYVNEYNSEKDDTSEIYDSLNYIKNENKEINLNDNQFNDKLKNDNNISINNDDSVLKEAFNSLNLIPNKAKIKSNEPIYINQKENILNNYSIDNIKENINSINNEEENVNLGISFSKISEPEMILNNKANSNNINEENNNQGIITPNTSIYNLSETITKKSEQINDNNQNVNKNIKLNLNNNKTNNNFLFEENSLLKISKNQKFNKSLEEFNLNEEVKEKDIIINNNKKFFKNKNIEEKEINDNNDNINLNKIIEENLALKKNKRNNNIISKRFELLNKNKKQLDKDNSSIPLNTNISNNVFKSHIIYKETTEKVYNNSIINSINENKNYIYLCPFCKKETPEIMELKGVQDDIKKPTIDKISISCSCGNYELDLLEYINALEEKKAVNSLKENCYNDNHELIKASLFCSKCNKWFCEKCLLFHKSLLPDHITTPTKIPKFSKCLNHPENDIIYFCHKCKIGICKICKNNSHGDHYSSDINDYFNKTYISLPFTSFEELNQFIEHCNRISQKEKDSYVNYIEDMIMKLNDLKNRIIDNYDISLKRRITQQKLVKYLFGNFICFNENYQQIKNMNSINYICPTLFLYNDIDFFKNANNYSLYLNKESFIEINPDIKLNKEEINNIFDKYKPILKEIISNNSLNKDININKMYINTFQSESNYIFPTLFKVYNNNGIYYGEIDNNKRNGIGKQINKNEEYEGIWEQGEIIKGKAIYFSEQGNIIYQGEFKDGLENGYGEKIYSNNRVYKGIFINGKIDSKYEIQKKLEIPNT